MDDVFVGQVMTDPVLTIGTDTPVAEAGEAILSAGIKSVVAIDDDCHPEGIITSTDFVRLAADRADPGEVTVGDYMTTDIVTTTADVAVPEVADLMLDEEINHLPVVGDDGKAVGIVTTTDLAAYVSEFDLAESASTLP